MHSATSGADEDKETARFPKIHMSVSLLLAPILIPRTSISYYFVVLLLLKVPVLPGTQSFCC